MRVITMGGAPAEATGPPKTHLIRDKVTGKTYCWRLSNPRVSRVKEFEKVERELQCTVCLREYKKVRFRQDRKNESRLLKKMYERWMNGCKKRLPQG